MLEDIFSYKDGILHIESVSVAELAASIGTPFYAYSQLSIERCYGRYRDAFSGMDARIFYAVKANSNRSVLKILHDLGSGMDVVSEGELRRALSVGVSPCDIVFAGVGKTRCEIAYALDCGIFCFNVESSFELEMLSEIASSRNYTVRVALRVNPGVDGGTHEKITTGTQANKFGISAHDILDMYIYASSLPGIIPCGLHVHIGSQIGDLEPLRRSYEIVIELGRELRRRGFEVSHLDLGGGLGIGYYADGRDCPADIESYASMVGGVEGVSEFSLYFEPGRYICAGSGILVMRVIGVKDKRFVVVDGAMNDFLRPTLYGGHHELLSVSEPVSEEMICADIVGGICESGDYLAQNRLLPLPAPGSLLCLRDVGAYGSVLSSEYNSRLLIPEVLVLGDNYSVIRARPDYDTMLFRDHLAIWQQ